MHRNSIKKKNKMSKFKNLVEIAKNNVEAYILEDVGTSGIVFLPTETNDLISVLGGDFYYTMLCQAGYSDSTAERKVNNMDYDKLVIALDDWYKTEMYPKLYNKFKSEGKKILDY